MCSSVRLSVCQTRARWQNEIIVCKYVDTEWRSIFYRAALYATRSFRRASVRPSAKVALCANCQRQSCRAFTGQSIRAQIVGGGHPLKYKFVREVNHPLARRRCILWNFNRCLLTGETNCNSNLQQCSLNTENNIDICATTDPHGSAVSLR